MLAVATLVVISLHYFIFKLELGHAFYVLPAVAGAIVLYLFSRKQSSASLILAAGVIGSYKPGLFYYWDEWELLNRFANGEAPANHNEHFLPFFLPLLRTAFSIVGDNYQLLVFFIVALHLISALLLFDILKRYFTPRQATLGCLFFVASAHHAESLSWALLGGLATVKLLVVVAVYFIPRCIPVVGFCCLVGPWFSSLGWLMAFQLCIFSFFYERKALKKTLVYSGLGTGLCLALFASLFGKISNSVASNFVLVDFIKYLLVATEVSTLRALGAIPTLGLNYGLIAELIGISERSLFAILVFAGLGLSLVILKLTSLKEFLFFKLSQLFWLGPVLVARLGLKARGALSVRYHEPTVFSLSFIAARLLTPALLFSILAVQFFMSFTFRLEERYGTEEISPNSSEGYISGALKFIDGPE